ncbi:MAG: prepilin peptidase [Actinomycetes bacterium]
MGPASSAILFAVLALATLSDLRSRLIPNSLSLGGSLALVVVACLEGGPPAAGLALMGGFAASVAPGLVHLAKPNGMGGGDVKLSFAIGCGLGPAGAIAVALASFLAVSGALARVPLDGRSALRAELPFAPYLAAGALAALCVA